MRRIALIALILALAGPSAIWGSSESTAVEVGSSAGSALGTLVYVPFKVTFCILGGIGSGFTAIASPPAAGRVAMATCGGSWLVTPAVVRGHETLKFLGDTPANRSTAAR